MMPVVLKVLMKLFVCGLQPPRSFTHLMAGGGPTVWPMWELVKCMFGKSDHTVAAIGTLHQHRQTHTLSVVSNPEDFHLRQSSYCHSK